MTANKHTGERNRGYALLMKANKPETALYTVVQEREIEGMHC